MVISSVIKNKPICVEKNIKNNLLLILEKHLICVFL